VERETIREYMRLTPEQKLQWLEEILLFTEEALTPNARKVRDHFRNSN
jgi:hypothetical protein